LLVGRRYPVAQLPTRVLRPPQYDDAVFKRAKKVRDNLSHGSTYSESDLMEMEVYIREMSRFILRRELETRGIFLDGEPKPISELPVVEMPFVASQNQGDDRVRVQVNGVARGGYTTTDGRPPLTLVAPPHRLSLESASSDCGSPPAGCEDLVF
jgi:hypothetical protein